ncbi:MAG: hypothetical protein CM15mP129_01750 [Chloroflexota bacterium]|nr:MAG: hypothetical protein CM15mP129_01750 [Chloroflexota bacterium]
MEQFSPLIKFDIEMKNSLKLLTEIRKDRMLSLSFDNNLLTEIRAMSIFLDWDTDLKIYKLDQD